LGKLPPPYMGPAIATQIILRSALNEKWNLHHFDTRLNTDIRDMGKWSMKKSVMMLRRYKAYKKMLAEVRPDLVLVPISQTTMGFAKDAPYVRMAKQSGAKVVVQLRGSDFKNWLNKASKRVYALAKNTLQQADAVIVLGNNLKYLFEDFFDQKDIYVVPNGGNFTFPEVEKNSRTPLQILYFANFLRNKGFIDVLQAITLLPENLPVELVAAGAWDDAAYRAECLEIIERNGLSNVRLLDKCSGDEKWQLFAQADVFVFCPVAPEGHPWVIVEAMAAGLPVITTNQGAIAESVIDGKNGYIVPPANPKAIAGKLTLLLQNEMLRKKMSEAAKKHYSAYFTEEKMVENLSNVFYEVLQK